MLTTYMKVSHRHYFDYETNKLVWVSDLKQPFVVDVPELLWTWQVGYSDGNKPKDVVQVKHGTHRRVDYFKLNQLKVQLLDSYRQAAIGFFNVKADCWMQIGISVSHRENFVGQLYKLFGFNCSWSVGQQVSSYSTKFKLPPWTEPNFRSISDLAIDHSIEVDANRFCFGVRGISYRVRYNGRELNGDCYALVCGPWAILLDDEFRFDTLAMLNGATSVILDVDRFLYTVNPYITKVITLTR